MKKFLKQLGCCIFFASLLTCVAFATGATEEELDMAYREYCTVAEEMDKFVTLDYHSFIDNYNESGLSLDAYSEQCISNLENNESLSKIREQYRLERELYRQQIRNASAIEPRESLEKWWHHTETLPQATAYTSTHGLLDKVKKGDIVYEAAGGFGVTGHIALVEGIHYSPTYQQHYIRVIEAVSSGVCYGILCDERFFNQHSIIYRLTHASAQTIGNAMDFAYAQKGKPYSLLTTDLNISRSRATWYCSLLAACAYYHGSNGSYIIDGTSEINGKNLITPRSISRYCANNQTTVVRFDR